MSAALLPCPCDADQEVICRLLANKHLLPVINCLVTLDTGETMFGRGMQGHDRSSVMDERVSAILCGLVGGRHHDVQQLVRMCGTTHLLPYSHLEAACEVGSSE